MAAAGFAWLASDSRILFSRCCFSIALILFSASSLRWRIIVLALVGSCADRQITIGLKSGIPGQTPHWAGQCNLLLVRNGMTA